MTNPGHLEQAANAVRQGAQQLTEQPLASLAALSKPTEEISRLISTALMGVNQGVQTALSSGALPQGRMASEWTQGAMAIEHAANTVLAQLSALNSEAHRMASMIGDLTSRMEGDATIILTSGG